MNSQCPAIHLNYTSKSLSPYVMQIEFGIEEEGLFSVRSLVPTSSLQESTYAAAQASKVGVAIGISEDQIFLMHRKAGSDRFILKKGSPLMTDSEGRLFGKSAARIVKGMPLCQK